MAENRMVTVLLYLLVIDKDKLVYHEFYYT